VKRYLLILCCALFSGCSVQLACPKEVIERERDAIYKYYENGNLREKKYKDGEKHIFSEDGRLTSKTIVYRDQKHRKTNTSVISFYYPNGRVHFEIWQKHYQPHRLNGPAVIYYSEEGQITCRYWFIEGERTHNKEEKNNTNCK